MDEFKRKLIERVLAVRDLITLRDQLERELQKEKKKAFHIERELQRKLSTIIGERMLEYFHDDERLKALLDFLCLLDSSNEELKQLYQRYRTHLIKIRELEAKINDIENTIVEFKSDLLRWEPLKKVLSFIDSGPSRWRFIEKIVDYLIETSRGGGQDV